jgi:hypothetical protein
MANNGIARGCGASVLFVSIVALASCDRSNQKLVERADGAADLVPNVAAATPSANDGSDALRPVLPDTDHGFVDARHGSGWGDRCWANIRAAKWGWAKAECDEALKLNPAKPQPRASLLDNEGLIAKAAGQTEEARERFAASLALRDSADVRGALKALDGLAAAPPGLGAGHSSFGQFETVVGAANQCQTAFVHTSGKRTHLFYVPDCIGKTPGSDILGPVARVGELNFPARDAEGNEFHLFEIATARGGNAVAGSDYWVAVIRSNLAWAPLTPVAVGELKAASVESGTLVLSIPPTTTQSGSRAEVTFGAVKNASLPMRASSALSVTKRELVGEFQGGSHADNFHHSVQDVFIDDDGQCAINEIAMQGVTFHVTVEVTKMSDGRTTVKCISARR